MRNRFPRVLLLTVVPSIIGGFLVYTDVVMKDIRARMHPDYSAFGYRPAVNRNPAEPLLPAPAKDALAPASLMDFFFGPAPASANPSQTASSAEPSTISFSGTISRADNSSEQSSGHGNVNVEPVDSPRFASASVSPAAITSYKQRGTDSHAANNLYPSRAPGIFGGSSAKVEKHQGQQPMSSCDLEAFKNMEPEATMAAGLKSGSSGAASKSWASPTSGTNADASRTGNDGGTASRSSSLGSQNSLSALGSLQNMAPQKNQASSSSGENEEQ